MCTLFAHGMLPNHEYGTAFSVSIVPLKYVGYSIALGEGALYWACFFFVSTIV